MSKALLNLSRTKALQLIEHERERQLELKAEGRFLHTPSDDALTNFERHAMISEELGEVARESLALEGLVQEKPDEEKLKKELVQVAALSLAWLERLV